MLAVLGNQTLFFLFCLFSKKYFRLIWHLAHVLETIILVLFSCPGCLSHFAILLKLQDFLSPHVKMFSDRDFGKLGVNVNLTGPVISMDETGYGMKTHSADVTSGV